MWLGEVGAGCGWGWGWSRYGDSDDGGLETVVVIGFLENSEGGLWRIF